MSAILEKQKYLGKEDEEKTAGFLLFVLKHG
jgi:hypothetical protein